MPKRVSGCPCAEKTALFGIGGGFTDSSNEVRRAAVWRQSGHVRHLSPSQRADQRVEGLASGARMNAAPAIEAEQWRSRVRFRMGGQAPLDLAADQFGDSGAVRNEAALAEFAASHHQQAAISINISQAESTHLSCAQTESIAE